MNQLQSGDDSPIGSPTTASPKPWIGLPMLLYITFFVLMGAFIYGAVKWVRPSFAPVSPALQGWASAIFYCSVVCVPTIAVAVSIIGFRRPVARWPVIELLFVGALVSASSLNLFDPFLGRPWFDGAIVVLASVFFAISIQSTVFGLRSAHWWKAISGILAVLATGVIAFGWLGIVLFKID